MSTQKLPLLALTRKASAALTAHQLVSALGAVATAGGPILGAAVTNAANGDDVALDVLGTTTLIADGAVTDGMALEVGADGAATENADGMIVAIALEAAADEGLFEALLIPHGIILDTIA